MLVHMYVRVVRLGKMALFGNESLEEATGGASQLEQLGAPGVEELSAEQSRWMVTQKAEASPPARLPIFGLY